MNDVFDRLQDKAKEKGAIGNSAIARLLNESPQVVTNWQKRGIPPRKYLDIAKALGVSVEWLQTGKESRNRVDAQALPVISLDDATPEDLARIILAYEQSSDLKKQALQKLSELPEDKLNAILALLG